MHRKPVKPYKSFPLTPHRRGWCKKIHGKVRIICGHVPAAEALRVFHLKAPRLYGYPTEMPTAPAPVATNTPQSPAATEERRENSPITVGRLKEEFLAHKQAQVATGELSPRSFADYQTILDRFTAAVSGRACDLAPKIFAQYRQQLATTLGPHALSRHIQNIRTMFAWGYESERLANPVRYGGSFDKPSATIKRKAKAKRELLHGKAMFSPEEIRLLLAKADKPLKAAILLGLNGGLGNHDIAALPLTAVDLDKGWVDFPRPKTGIERRIPLWTETTAAIREAIQARPKPRDPNDRELIFLSPDGLPLVRMCHTYKQDKLVKSVPVDTLSSQFAQLLKAAGLRSEDVKREGLNFYGLRRTFRTVADEVCRDQHAIHRIMGHVVAGMAGIYVQRITDERLKAVTDGVRERWLLPVLPPVFGESEPLTAAERLKQTLDELMPDTDVQAKEQVRM